MFELTEEQLEKLGDWAFEQNGLAREIQLKYREERKAAGDDMWDDMPVEMYPYYGAIGGALTYRFTPTSIGVVVKVVHAITKNELDLTEDW